jgi:hypothetical protein
MNEQHSCTAHYRGRSGAVARRTSVEVLAKLLRAAAQKTTARKTTSAGSDQSLLTSAKHVTVCRTARCHATEAGNAKSKPR